MRVLVVSPRVPWPLVDGGRIAMHNLAVSLRDAGCSVEVLSLNPNKHKAGPEELPASGPEALSIETIGIDTTLRLPGLVRGLISKESYLVTRFDSPELSRRLRQKLARGRYDVVQIESPFMGFCIEIVREAAPDAIISLRSLNVEHVVWERLASHERSTLRRLVSRRLAWQLARYERTLLSRLDALVTVTREDAAQFEKLGFEGPVEVIPVGLDLTSLLPTREIAPNAVFSIGSLDYRPNIEGLEWYVREVVPRLRAARPDLRITVVGSGAGAALASRLRAAGIDYAGRASDAHEFMRSHGVMAVPLLSGGGMRVKIIEAWALGVPVVSTTIGAEGLGAASGRELLLANEPRDFSTALLRILDDPRLAPELAAAGRKLVERELERGHLGRKLTAFYTHLLASRT